MKSLDTEINWKGIGDYLSAARTISEHGSSNTCGPRIHCQGLALELCLKFYIWQKNGEYPATHDLELLASLEYVDIQFSDKELDRIKMLNKQYLHDETFPFPSRYRPNTTRAFISISQADLESLVTKIVGGSPRPELISRIMAR